MKEPNPRLGRGLASLLGDPTSRTDKEPIGELNVTAMEPSPFQPRGPIDPASLTELTDSIRARGLLQPLLVRHIRQSLPDTRSSPANAAGGQPRPPA